MTKVRVVRSSALLALIASGLVACGSASPATPDTPWIRVSEKTSCETMNPRECRGVYGFAVTPDGHYVVGPADDGTTVAGPITDSDRARLSGDVALVAGRLGRSPECGGAPSVPGGGDEVDLTDGQGVVRPVYAFTLKGVCTLGTRDGATRLHDDLQAMMTVCYPRPFPN